MTFRSTKPVRLYGVALSTTEIMALRSRVEHDETDPEIHANTMRSLKRKQLLDDDGKPTEAGKRWATYYVKQTGDGPELLKECFRL